MLLTQLRACPYPLALAYSAPMDNSGYRVIKDSLRALYLDDPRPWLVGYSGGKDSAMVRSSSEPV